MVHDANEDMASLLAIPVSSSASSEGCERVDCFGVKNKMTIAVKPFLFKRVSH